MDTFLIFEFILLIGFIIVLSSEEKKKLRILKESKSEVGIKEFNGPTPLPIIGNALQWLAVGCTRNLYDTVHEFCRRYGSVCGLWIGSNYFIFVEDPVIGREILNRDDLSRKFPATSITYTLYGPQNLGISQAHGDVLKEMRRFSSRGLKRFGFGKLSSMNEIVQVELTEYLQQFELSRIKGDSIIEMDESFYISTLNILWRLMTDRSFTQHDERLIHIIYLGRDILKKDSIGASLPHAFPWITDIPGLTLFQTAKQFWTEIRALLGEILAQRRATGTFRTEPKCFIDLFLQEIDSSDGYMYSDAQCVQTCMDLFVAGLDSTANTLDWMIIYLISHSDVYTKVMEEITNVIGYERLSQIQDRTLMPYTEAVMLEVLRIANVITYTMRAPLHETTFQGYRIPENSHILVKLSCFHTDANIWGDPQNFRPDRFLDSNSNIVNAEKIFTFGYGKRACIGEVSSKMTIFLFLTTILQKYTLEISPKHQKPCLTPERGVLISHPRSYHLMATPNLPNTKWRAGK